MVKKKDTEKKTTKQFEFTTKIFKTKSCVLRWRSTWKRVLRVATEETFRPKWADAGRSRVAAAAILLKFKPLALLKAAPLDDWSTAAVRSLKMKKKKNNNPKASNAPDVSKKKSKMFLVCYWGRWRTELIFILTVRPIYDINGGIKKKIKLHKEILKNYNFVKKKLFKIV